MFLIQNHFVVILDQSLDVSSKGEKESTDVTKTKDETEDGTTCKAESLALMDDRRLSKFFIDHSLHVSLSLAPIDLKDDHVTFRRVTSKEATLEIGEFERIVSDIISAEGSFPPILNVPALLKILCSVQFVDLDVNAEIVLAYQDVNEKSWKILENVILEKQDYGKCFIFLTFNCHLTPLSF